MKHKTNRIGLLTLTFLLGSITAIAQTQPSNISGTYEGVAKRPGAAEQKVTLELKSEGGKISGRAKHGEKSAEVTSAKLENGTLTLNFGNNATFIAKVDGDKLVGEAVHGTEKIPMELKKVTPVASAVPAAAGPVNLNGEWDGVADANGQPFPFVLVLKVEGESVTGSSSSQLGDSQVKSGSWKEGKLVFQLDGSNAVISMSATVVDGKLSGEFDYAGQLQGKWVAIKKN